MIEKIIALDDPHGWNTAGKRTPKFSDGSWMRENEFGSATIHKLAVMLLHKGFTVFYTAPTVADVPLKERVKTANVKSADILVSLHANAAKNGSEFSYASGVETYCYKFGGNGESLARSVHEQLIKGTKQKDRGVKEGNFAIIRDSLMPAILVEAAFMTNKEEAKLLMSDEFRTEVAREIYQGICNYFVIK